MTPLARSAARQLRKDVAGDAPLRLDELTGGARAAAAAAGPRTTAGARGAVHRAMLRQAGPSALPGVAPEAAAAPRPAAPAAIGFDPRRGFPAFDREPVTGMRRTIATRLAASKRDAPHYYMTVECIADPLLAMRRDLNATLSADDRLSVNDVVLTLVARCVARHPALNAAWDGDGVVRFRAVNLAVAVAVDGGLVTPVVRDAGALGFVGMHRAVQALVDAARRRALPREAFEGGTFTVSNLGMYPVSHFAAIVNPPQAAILAVAAAERRVVALDDERSAIRRVMSVTLSVDHRAADGVAGAEFLADLKALVEEPRRMLL